MTHFIYILCSRSSDPFYIARILYTQYVSYYCVKSVTTAWTQNMKYLKKKKKDRISPPTSKLIKWLCQLPWYLDFGTARQGTFHRRYCGQCCSHTPLPLPRICSACPKENIIYNKHKHIQAFLLNLTFDGVFSDLSFDGGGGSKCPPPFLFVKTIEKVIRLCTVLKKKLFDWQF